VKVPLVTDHNLVADSVYPAPGSIACRIIASNDGDAHRRRIVIVDTDEPDAIESEDGISGFEVFADQLTDD
jgi:hypothetical protein